MLSDSLLTMLLLAIPLVFAAMALFTAGYEHCLNTQLQRHGITIEAAIVELIRDVWRGTRNCYLLYEYKTATGDVQTQRQPIAQAHYDRLVDSDNRVVLISYLPTNTSLSRLTGDDSDHTVRDSALKRATVLLLIWMVLAVIALN